ncbi:MAG: hypothetical protein IJU66_00375 [Oscillospiraceae bacterium]|nr:hypothetical protein [Oscillospiraceae bacterium]
MYDYLRALYERFALLSNQSGDLYQAAAEAHDALHATLNEEQRKLLLRFGDAEDERCEEAGFSGFLAGFHLAVGLAEELRTLPVFSFEDDNAMRAKRSFE